MTRTVRSLVVFLATLECACLLSSAQTATVAEVENVAINGSVADGKARLVIEAILKGDPGATQKPLFATTLNHAVHVARQTITHSFELTLEILQGHPKEFSFVLSGEGQIREVNGDRLQDWSVRQETNGVRKLVLRPQASGSPQPKFTATITARQTLPAESTSVLPLTLIPPDSALFNGYVIVGSNAELHVQVQNPSGIVPLELSYLPESLRRPAVLPEPLAFRFHGGPYALPLLVSLADPEANRVVLTDFKLVGQLGEGAATFELQAVARVKNPKGASIVLLSGNAALTGFKRNPYWRFHLENGSYVLKIDRAGEFPIQANFDAAVQTSDVGKSLDFSVAPAALQPIVLRGPAADTEFQFIGAARPERAGEEFLSHLPADGRVKLTWKEARPETEGKLFYAAEMLSQITVSPGLMRQLAVLDYRIMQGELNEVVVLVRGEGEITRVQGNNVLGWKIEPVPNSSDRRLVVQFNQPQKDHFTLQMQVQTPLGAFPQESDAILVRPEGATRFSGYFRIVNDGAVRLEVVRSSGLSQISPEQFPESGVSKPLFPLSGNQRFAYRFSGADFALRIRAEQILPEVSVSQLLAFHFAENELAIDAEIELDIRETPLRELLIQIPQGYVIARLTASGMSDYFVQPASEQPNAELRLVYAQPISGRQLVQVRLERNQPLGNTTWILPRIEVSKAKSTRGHVGVSADAGFRLTPERVESLTEVATAFFPRKLAGIQAAFRLTGPAWNASLRIERLAQSIQADVFHLFSVGEGVAYGSSLMHYAVSGSPLGVFRVELSNEYFNVEFTGKDIRNWQRTEGGFLVQLHTPVAGAYTLLASYERPFKAQGETLSFTGARPLDVQTEQGYTIVTSGYQFQVTPVNVSSSLTSLETGEVPIEYRLFFDAPILAAYRYTSRPFNLTLQLSLLAQGDSLNQIVDRAVLKTRISKEGQVVTDARYYLKNRGNPHFRMTLPQGTQLWSATVNGTPAVPVMDAMTNLIPLPQLADPNAILTLDFKMAARSPKPQRVSVHAPTIAAPVMLAEWQIEPDAGQRLSFRKGTLMPAGGVTDVSGFAQLSRIFRGVDGQRAWVLLVSGFALVLLAVLIWRWSSGEGVYRFSLRHVFGLVLGLAAFLLGLTALIALITLAEPGFQPRDVQFVMPVQQAGSGLSVELSNLPDKAGFRIVRYGWPVIAALCVWIYGALSGSELRRSISWTAGWTLLAWAALRWPNGALGFFILIAVFLLLHLALPGLRRLARSPSKPKPATPSPAQGGPAPAAASVAIGGLIWIGTVAAPLVQSAESSVALEKTRSAAGQQPIAESVRQKIQVEDTFAHAAAQIRWRAVKGELLPILYEPAVLTRIDYPTNALKLVQSSAGPKRAQQLLALETGVFDVSMEYHLHVSKRDGEGGLILPTRLALINEVTVTLLHLDVDVVSSHAVSINRQFASENTTARLVLAPADEAWVGWKPRTRNVKTEKPIFYADVWQLYVPSAGVVEGAHHLSIRPAQGELTELIVHVPGGATITDVTDAAAINPAKAETQNIPNSIVSLWRFDPETRKLRVSLTTPQSRPFALVVRSQVATGPLPFEQSIGLLSVEQAAAQIGLMGVATGHEVQLDSVTGQAFSPINLEDFPNWAPQVLQAQIPGLTVRRAYRYADTTATAVVKASPVQPDIRVEAQSTLSLGEDRIVLAANLDVEISRAGIFRLTFALPTGLEVDAITGEALSHWTELASDEGRIVTLHLRGKTEGQQKFSVTLTGSGVKTVQSWAVPHLLVREAAKQRGTLVIVPEQGMRLQVSARTGVTQLDPEKAGIRQKGVLVFRLVQAPWSIALDIEQVDAWIQVNGLQHATISEAQVKVAANLHYQIENTGLKALRVFLPDNAENVRLAGEQIADFLPVNGAVTNNLQQWEAKLHRRVIGRYILNVSYQLPLAEQATNAVIRGLQASDVNMQRGFLTLQSSGRLQLRIDQPPAAVQPVEWQSIPSQLQQNLPAASAHFAFRVIEPSFQFSIAIERHEAARLLPARITEMTLQSVVSDNAVILTRARLQMIPGDKRLLHLKLPREAKFWFAFVDERGVWPWREDDRILIPLEQQSRDTSPISVEVFYTSDAGDAHERSLDVLLIGPKFDLPLENVTWHVYLSEKWRLEDWKGTLQLREEQTVEDSAALNIQTYLEKEATAQQDKTRRAEQLLNTANSWLENGDPQQARRAFEAAYNLSTHDNAFNEDARVQLHNLKVQQAIVGLNVRQSSVVGERDPLAAKLRDAAGRQQVRYTQQEAKEIMDRKSADENSALVRLAERIVQQQDAALSNPAAIRASVPRQGRQITFERAVVVDAWADLRIDLEAKAAAAASWPLKISILAATFFLLAVVGWTAKSFRTSELD